MPIWPSRPGQRGRRKEERQEGKLHEDRRPEDATSSRLLRHVDLLRRHLGEVLRAQAQEQGVLAQRFWLKNGIT